MKTGANIISERDQKKIQFKFITCTDVRENLHQEGGGPWVIRGRRKGRHKSKATRLNEFQHLDLIALTSGITQLL